MEAKDLFRAGVTLGGPVTVNGPMFDIHDNACVEMHVQCGEGAKCERDIKTPAEGVDAKMPSAFMSVKAQDDGRILHAVSVMQQEGIFKHAYDYAWVMLVMNQTRELPHFDSIPSFHIYLSGIGIKNLPSLSSVTKKVCTARREHPGWTFADTADANETRRRNNVASRFLSLVRKG